MKWKMRCGRRALTFFFFQAEDGIRDVAVTGVQTCALPISDLADPPEVVAGEVDEHDVLGALLRVGREARRESFVFLRVGPPTDRARDRTHLCRAAAAPDEHLRGGSENRGLAGLEEEEVGRRVQRPEGAVDVEGVASERRTPALREHDLVDLAREDRLLCPEDGPEESLARDRGSEARRPRLPRSRRRGPAGAGAGAGVFRAADRRLEEVELDLRPLAIVTRGQEQQASSRVVEGDDGVEPEKERVGDAALPRVTVGYRLEEPRGVVGEVSDGTAAERREVGVGPEAFLPGEAVERGEGGRFGWALDALRLDLDVGPPDRQPRGRGDPQERVSRDRFLAFPALEEEALGARRTQAPEELDRLPPEERDLPRDRARSPIHDRVRARERGGREERPPPPASLPPRRRGAPATPPARRTSRARRRSGSPRRARRGW